MCIACRVVNGENYNIGPMDMNVGQIPVPPSPPPYHVTPWLMNHGADIGEQPLESSHWRAAIGDGDMGASSVKALNLKQPTGLMS